MIDSFIFIVVGFPKEDPCMRTIGTVSMSERESSICNSIAFTKDENASSRYRKSKRVVFPGEIDYGLELFDQARCQFIIAMLSVWGNGFSLWVT